MNGKGSATAANSGVHWKSGEVVSDKFPVGLRVLVVDDDPTCLMILEKMLQTCLYEATKCNRAEVALSLLRENKNGFDIVLSDVHMPDMDGFKLLEHVGLEMDLPVIMMSADDSQHVVMKGVTHGACDYLIKPVRIEALKNIWQHVVRKRKNEWKDGEQSGSVEDGDRQQKQSEDADYSSSANEGNWKSSKKRKEDEDEAEDRDDTSTLKKPRVVWAVELHQQFVAAVNQLGIDKAVPKKILELMSVPGLTRENVASHLQKYRLYLRRVSAQHPGGLNTPFMTHQEAAFASLSSMNALDLQSLASSGQLPSQSLATIQAAALGRSTAKSGITMPGISPKNLFSFENSNLRFGERQPLNNNNAKQISLLHGVPTSIEPKQLASLHPSAQTFGSMNMQINPRGGQNNGFLMQTRGLIPNENTIGHIARVPPISQPILSNGITSGGLTRNVMAETGRGAVYSQAGINFPPNPNADPPGNFFQLGSASGLSTHTSKGVFQEEPNSEIKGSRGFVGSYDIFGEQPKSQEWGLQNVGMTYSSQQASPVQDNLDVLSSVLVQQQQGVPSCQSSLQNCSMAVVGPENGNMNIFSQHLNPLLVDNSSRIKAERIPHSNSGPAPFSNHYSQEDLMNAFFRQQQDCITPAEGEFDFDGYSLDNIPV